MKKEIILNQYYSDFVRKKIAMGRFKNFQEMMQAALYLLDREEKKKDQLRKEIQLGIDSRINGEFNPPYYLEILKESINNNT